MKLNNIKYWTLAAILGANLVSCDDFLDRPAEDSYNVDNFYQNDEQCFQGVNPLYNSPWFDFQRGFFKVGEVLAGNYYWGSSPYLTFTVNETDEDLINMSYSLWSVNAYANTIRERLQTAGGSEQTRNTCMGECLVWKAMAYFIWYVLSGQCLLFIVIQMILQQVITMKNIKYKFLMCMNI